MENFSEISNKGFARNDSTTCTRILDKHWSPMIVRKYQMEGWPMFVGLICDANLDDLDQVVHEAFSKAKDEGFANGTIQGVRNLCGFITDYLVQHYDQVKRGCVEGVGIVYYVDKLSVNSLWGDLMQHLACKLEFFQTINFLPHV